MNDHTKGVIVSGIQPSGSVHIGNYFGAIQQWVGLQEESEIYILIVDMHSLSGLSLTETRISTIKKTMETAALCIACGIDSNNILIQSQVKASPELMWILSTMSPLGRLERMTQFKDKSSKINITSIPFALLSYPILMAADILAFRANMVPVGDDQTQHLELANYLGATFNRLYNKDIFPTINKLSAPKCGQRLMSLTDGKKKMSKSDTSSMSYISLCDSNDAIKAKISSAKTDSYSDLLTDLSIRAETSNLLNILSLLYNNIPYETLIQEMGIKYFSQLKEILTKKMIELIDPIREKYNAICSDQPALKSLILEGNRRAKMKTDETMSIVRSLVYE